MIKDDRQPCLVGELGITETLTGASSNVKFYIFIRLEILNLIAEIHLKTF